MSLFGWGEEKELLGNSFQGIEDCHSHILPGVDDGVQNMEDSLLILSKYEELGVRKLWLTPHIMEDVPNETEALKKRFSELKDAYSEDREKRNATLPAVELSLAAEYMMDGLFAKRLASKDLLPHTELKNHLLVETSYFNPPYNFRETLENIMSAGYYPILAHPERYVYMNSKDYRELKEKKIRFQMNLSSLAGMYGKEAEKKARQLLKLSAYNFIGTDLHRKRQLDSMIETKVLPFRHQVII